MSTRHLSRTIAMQTLFEWDFNHHSQKMQKLIEENIKQYAVGLKNTSFVEELVRGVTKNLEAIDKIIEKYAPEWPIDKITIIDRNVLRIAIYEMLFEKEVPPKVVINESIEIAKTFGAESSGKFVNGVLGSIFNDIEEGKIDLKNIEEKSRKVSPRDKKDYKEVSVGAVVYKKDKEGLKFALIKDAINKWTFAKGKIGDNIEDEKITEALARELEEEIGVKNIIIKNKIGAIDVVVNKPDKEAYDKKIIYYLVESKDEELIPEKVVTVKDAKWFTEQEVLENSGYENTKDIFKKATKLIN